MESAIPFRPVSLSTPRAGKRRVRLLTAFLAAGLCVSSIAMSPARAGDKLTIFAAASLKNALEATAKAFTRQTGTKVVFSFAGTSRIARQIEAGAPADIFISADVKWMDHVKAMGAVDASTIRNIAANSLVLVAPEDRAAPLDLKDPYALSNRLDGQRLAIADPDNVPAGRYGKAALIKLGMWDSVEGKLAPMDNVRVALSAVARAETPLGLVYASDAAVQPDVAVVATFPDDSHPPIVYPAAETPDANPGATAFLTFLSGPVARKAFTSAGLKMPH